jgi:hypothetical protein
VHVTGHAQIRLLIDRRSSQYMVPFLGRERSMSEAATELDVTIGFLLPRVRRFVRLGLLEVTREAPRKGRPIRYYRAVGDEFFVPSDRLSVADLLIPGRRYDDLIRDSFVHLIEQISAVTPESGLRIYRKHGRIEVRISTSPEDDVDVTDALAPAAMWEYRFLRLSRERAKRLQLDILALLAAAEDDHGGADAHVVAVRMVPVPQRIDSRGLG